MRGQHEVLPESTGLSLHSKARHAGCNTHVLYTFTCIIRYTPTEGVFLRYLIVKDVFWYEVPRTLRGLAVGVRRLYLPSGVMNQVSDTKNRVVKA